MGTNEAVAPLLREARASCTCTYVVAAPSVLIYIAAARARMPARTSSRGRQAASAAIDERRSGCAGGPLIVRHMILGPSHGFNDPCRARRWSFAQGRQARTQSQRPGARRDSAIQGRPCSCWKTADARARRSAVRTNIYGPRGRGIRQKRLPRLLNGASRFASACRLPRARDLCRTAAVARWPVGSLRRL